MLADANQPYEKAEYSTFIAESASIGNEMLLNDYMVDHAKTREEKLYYLGQGLESIRQTFFRQVMFAEFQLQMHQELEQGAALSGEGGDLLPVVGATNNSADSDADDVEQVVTWSAAWVLEIAEVGLDC